MRVGFAIASLLTCSTVANFAAALPRAADPVHESWKAVQGNWEIVYHACDGMSVGKADGTGPGLGPTVKIKGDKIKLDNPDESGSTFQGVIVKEQGDLLEVNLVQKGDGDAVVWRGVGRHDDKLIRVRFATQGSPRPDSLKYEGAGDRNTTLILRRMEP